MSLLPTIGAVDQDTGFYNGVATQSLRFDIASTSYLKRQPSASNRKTYVLSFWLKPSKDTLNSGFLVARTGSGGTYTNLCFSASNNTIRVVDNQGSYPALQTSGKYRDVSAWYHIVFAVDTTQSTDSNKLKVYVNGTEQSYGTSYYYTTNDDTNINSTDDHYIGYNAGVANLDGYLAEYNFIDGLSFFSDTSGTANTSFNINSFGETKNGVWIAKAYSGSYGTNGYRLAFNSTDFNTSGSSTMTDPHGSGTAVPVNGLADASGQGNHWTTNGIGAVDFVSDSPENNFSTMNSLINGYGTNITMSEGNLAGTGTNEQYNNTLGTILMTSGKWYWEISSANFNNYDMLGIAIETAIQTTDSTPYGQTGVVAYATQGAVYNESASGSGSYTDFLDSEIIGIAVDLDSGTKTFKFYNDNSLQGTIDLSSAFDNIGILPFFCIGNTDTIKVNFGADSSFAGLKTAQGNTDGNGIGDFYYAPPSGYLALCTANLSDDDLPISPNADTQADNYFGTLTWSGDDNATRKIATGEDSVTGTVDFTPDWSWIKTINGGANGNDHLLLDIVRGVDSFNGLTANDGQIEGLTEAGSTWFNFGDINNFETGGFTVQKGPDGTHTLEGINLNSHTYVGWNWKLGGAPSADNSESAGATPTAGSVKIDGSNLGSALAGSIAATRLSANTTAGTSIVTYTGTGSNATVAHGLSSAPDVVMVKRRTGGTGFWSYWGTQFSATTDYIYLNITAAEDTGGATITNSTLPASTVFSIGTSVFVNASSDTYVAYCFHSVEGYSRFGTYTGNGVNDGTFVYLGFRPSFIMTKRAIGGTSDWIIQDSVRQTFNPSDAWLRPNSIAVEGTTSPDLDLDFVSNGFKIRNNGTNSNISGSTYIYMAFAENPFKYANAR